MLTLCDTLKNRQLYLHENRKNEKIFQFVGVKETIQNVGQKIEKDIRTARNAARTIIRAGGGIIHVCAFYLMI